MKICFDRKEYKVGKKEVEIYYSLYLGGLTSGQVVNKLKLQFSPEYLCLLFKREGFLMRKRCKPFIIFNDSKYSKVLGKWITTKRPFTQLGRDVWEFHNGKIENRLAVFFKDGNPDNYLIDNLYLKKNQPHLLNRRGKV